MGMFDWVDHTEPCTTCGEMITGFQSKDGPCKLLTLETWEVDHYYSFCENCKGDMVVRSSAKEGGIKVDSFIKDLIENRRLIDDADEYFMGYLDESLKDSYSSLVGLIRNTFLKNRGA